MAADKGLRIGIEGHAGAHDRLAHLGVGHVLQPHEQAKTVQQLRAQLPLLGVHGADQGDARLVLVRHAVALHAVGAAGAHVQQQVDQAIGQQIDLVHIQDPAMGARQQTGAELHGAALQGRFQVQ